MPEFLSLTPLPKIGASTTTHVAFADESNYSNGRYRGLGILSLESKHLSIIRQELHTLLDELNIKEFKWEKVRGAHQRIRAQKGLNYLIEKANQQIIRLDLLTWDTQDSRHKIRGRDDIANFHRMYHQLFKNVMRQRWPAGSRWMLTPDQNTAMKWHEVGFFLEQVSHTLDHNKNIFKPLQPVDLERHFSIVDIQPCESHHEPLVQLVDLMIGMAVFSRTELEKVQQWQKENIGQLDLLSQPALITENFSRACKQRCELIAHFLQQSKQHRLGVSLKDGIGLKTLNPNKPINFWPYTPQHSEDKAPIRQKSCCKLETVIAYYYSGAIILLPLTLSSK